MARPTFLSLLWELPQSTLGAIIFAGERMRGRIVKIEHVGDRVVCESTGTGLSLGHFVFWSQQSNRWHELDARNRQHELGHAAQSRMLGPLYLPVVGITSSARAVYAVLHREVTGERWHHYYAGFPESWADRLGAVDRGATGE